MIILFEYTRGIIIDNMLSFEMFMPGCLCNFFKKSGVGCVICFDQQAVSVQGSVSVKSLKIYLAVMNHF